MCIFNEVRIHGTPELQITGTSLTCDSGGRTEVEGTIPLTSRHLPRILAGEQMPSFSCFPVQIGRAHV